MRKITLLCLTMICLFGFTLAACQKEPIQGTGTGEREEGKGINTTFTARDYNRDEESVRKTEHGYYYYSYNYGGFRYVDGSTGKDMYLCNKPECKHDGNAFCVATNDKYTIFGWVLYDNRIVANVIEETDTQYLYKLLEIAADGSMANEIVTYYTMEKTGEVEVFRHGAGAIYIHRNKVMLPMVTGTADGLEDTECYGCAIVDLNTREVVYLDTEPLSRENAQVTQINAYGDYLYYCRKEGKKTVLHRYNINNGTDETHKLLVGFGGQYALPDEEHVVYTKSSGRELCVYSYATGENEEVLKFMGKRMSYAFDGSIFESEVQFEAKGLQTDGEYYYVAEESYAHIDQKNPVTGEVEEDQYFARVYVYNRAFELITVVNLADIRGTLLPGGETNAWSSFAELSFLGDKIYWRTYEGASKQYMFSCERSDFLAGNPEFRTEYKLEE